jgi:metallo-beta-lactamase class B
MVRREYHRLVIASLFLVVFGWSYLSAVQEQHSVAPVTAVTTEEGQRVAFDKETYQFRELAKRLPIQEPWPSSRQEMEKAIQRFGLDRNPYTRTLPVRIAPDVYLVGQDRLDNLTYMMDCGPEGVAIIDPTLDSEFDRTVANVERCGRSRRDIRWVLNTHCHVDHSMADKKFQEMGAKVILHEADAAAIEKGTQVTGYSYLPEWYPELFAPGTQPAFPRCVVDHRLSDGEELQLGTQKILVIHTPGHTPGSACFWLKVNGENLLFSGDTVLYDYRAGWQSNPYADNHQYLASVQKLENFHSNLGLVRWDVLLPGHGAMVLDKAYLDVEKVRSLVEGDLAQGQQVEGWPYLRPDYRKRMYGRPGLRKE